MYPIVLAQGDFGRPISITHCLANGQSFTPTELAASTITMRIYRVDRLKTEMIASVDNAQISINPRNITKYVINDTITIDDELMTITAVDYNNSFITVTRVTPLPHRRGRSIRHVISESTASVAWTPSASSLVWTPEPDETARIGTFNFELGIDVGGTKQATATLYSWQQPYMVTILQHGETI